MKKILVAVDGSQRQSAVIDAAVTIARATGARLTLFRSVGIPREVPVAAFTATPDEVVNILERQARSELESLAGAIDPALSAGVRVTVGIAWQAIERAAQDAEADLIVIGSHGYGGMDRLLGTTAAKVVNHADRSVLVVRAAERLHG